MQLNSNTSYTLTGVLQPGHAYLYDAMGNQVRDIRFTNTGILDTTFHIYDGNNTPMATYIMQTPFPTSDRMGITERYVYGSERIATTGGTNWVGITCFFCTGVSVHADFRRRLTKRVGLQIQG